MPTPSGGSRRTDPAILASAALALTAGAAAVVLSLRPERAADLARMAAWTSAWLGGADIYGASSLVDYPPWAIVAFSPLALAAASWLTPAWVAVNAVLLVTIARTLAARLRLSDGPALTVLTALLIAAGAGRTLNQFSIVAMAAGVAAIFGPAAGIGSAYWRGIALGLSLVKPQIGVVFLCVSVGRRDWRGVGIAVAVMAGLTWLYAAVADVAVTSVPAAYLHALANGQGSVGPGQTEVAPWVWPSGPSLVVTAALFASLATPAIWSERRARWGFLALASLMSVRHLSYDFILLLPWLAGQRAAAAWIVSILLVANPTAVATLAAPDWPLGPHLDRIALAAAWLVCAGRLAWRRYSSDRLDSV